MMGSSDSDRLGLLAHDLAHLIARIASDADLLALDALEAVAEAYGPGPRFDAVEAQLASRRAQIRESHQLAVDGIRLARIVGSPDRAVAVRFSPVRISDLLHRAIERSGIEHVRVSDGSAGKDVRVVCDDRLMFHAFLNLLVAARREQHGRSDATIETAFAFAEVVVRFPWVAGASGGSPQAAQLAALVTTSILALHGGSVSLDSEGPETQLRWPRDLTPGPHTVVVRPG